MATPLKTPLALIALTLALWQSVEPAAGQDTVMSRKEMAQLNWLTGPTTVPITDYAEMALPEGYVALSSVDTAALMKTMQTPSSGEEYYVGPADQSWYAVFSYQETGHVQDDERVDPDLLIAFIRGHETTDNIERRRRGQSDLRIRGWRYSPSYDSTNKRLAWAVEGESDDAVVVTYSTRILGRIGVMSATMVVDSSQVDAAARQFQNLLEGFYFLPGHAYAEYRAGDKLATKKLSALISEPPPDYIEEPEVVVSSITVIVGSVIAGLMLGALAWWVFGRKS